MFNITAAVVDLKDVLAEVLDVTCVWKQLGAALGLRRGKLEEIDHDHRTIKRRMWEVISLWLGGSGVESSWRNLSKALSQVGKDDLADAIEKKLTDKTAIAES